MLNYCQMLLKRQGFELFRQFLQARSSVRQIEFSDLNLVFRAAERRIPQYSVMYREIISVGVKSGFASVFSMICLIINNCCLVCLKSK